MYADKKVISNLTLCYCVAPLICGGRRHFLVASEKEHPCLLFDERGNQVDEVWQGPGGTMTMVQLPGADGAFLATHRFYSPNNSAEASIVLCRRTEAGWQVRTVAELPYVHRFDILQRDGVRYLLACCLKSGYEYKDDWRFPGMTLACRLPGDLLEQPESYRLPLQVVRDGMLRNHGYSRDVHNGADTGIVTCEEGVFRFTPPGGGEETWQIERLVSGPTSDALMLDFDGDGEKELLTMGPFHGDTVRVFKAVGGVYEKVWEYEKKLEFAHAICAAKVGDENVAVIGHRKGDRDLLAVRYAGGGYRTELLDHDVGPANALYARVDGEDVILAANRETDEVAYYRLKLR